MKKTKFTQIEVMFFKSKVVCNNQSFILEINKAQNAKLGSLFQLIETGKLDISKAKNIEIITDCIMKKIKKSDNAFLLWLFLIGEHINIKYDTKWALIRFNISQFDDNCFYPILINSEKDIWLAGTDLSRYYYDKRRMHGIGFLTFYKTFIERVLGKTKLSNYEGIIKELIILE
ncbi:hypothetical protein [Hyunsoonleella sp. 2307UL5-6]|uniref:hypothetical protein n=1 Tax=Hyunsoonleella sp. 2307UL5-6 TaxID=3384768 RepID=UPI0039BD1F1A